MGSVETNKLGGTMIGYYIPHRNDVYDNKEITKLVVSFTIGDGGLWVPVAIRKNGSAVYHTSKLWKNMDYILWQSIVLSQITKVYIRRQPASGMHKESLRMKTMSHPFFTALYRRMYINARKTITFHDLKHFDAESLAYLIQDDGSINITSENYYRMIICTDSFSEPECKLLRDVIAEQVGVHSDVIRYKNNYRLRFNKKQTDLLIDMIQPYVAPSFYYKLRQTPSLQTAESWLQKLHQGCQDYGIVRTLLKDSDLYRNVEGIM